MAAERALAIGITVLAGVVSPAPTPVHDEALAGDEARGLAREEADRVGDVLDAPEPPHRHGGEVALEDLGGHAGMALHGHEPGRHAVDRDPEGRQLPCPAPGQPDLRRLRRGVGGATGWRSVGDLRIDLDDAPERGGPHGRKHRPAHQNRALDEEVQLGQVLVPAGVVDRGVRLGTRGVQHEHLDRPEETLDTRNEVGHLALVRDVAHRELRDAPVATDGGDDVVPSPVTGQSVDGDPQAVRGEAPGDGRAEAAGAPGHERDATVAGRAARGHVVPFLPPPRPAGSPPRFALGHPTGGPRAADG